MLMVHVVLHSAVTGEVTEIARMKIVNNGTGSLNRGNYVVDTIFGRGKHTLDLGRVARSGIVTDWPRKQRHVWELVMKSLDAVGYRVPNIRKDHYARKD
jgi:hypothetical protein